MNYTELSLENLRKASIEAAKKITEDNKIDLLIYVARAGLPIAVYMNEILNVQLLGIGAQRKGNTLKRFVGPILSHLPIYVRNALISVELKSNVYKLDSQRNVEFHESLKEIDRKKIEIILIVDDSVDTGYSMLKVYKRVSEQFPKARIVTYGLNVWDRSKSIFKTDYESYRNTVIRAPMSKDSKEYKTFCKMYNSKTMNGYL